MSFSTRFSVGFFSGAAISSDVPSLYDVGLDGHPFLIDRAIGEHRFRTIPLLTPQTQTSDKLGERSINPAGLWRSSMETWHKGAGQDNYDLADSDGARFRASKGCDVWTKWKLSMLPDTESITSSANTNLLPIPVGSYLYEVDGQQVYQRASLAGARSSAVIHNGEGATTVESACTDGFTVYAALGANGIHTTERGATSSTHFSDLQATLVAYVKGRLMAAKTNAIYNVIASGAAPTALFTHPNTDWTWVGFAEGPSHIYAAGYSGDKSIVYGTTIKADGTALDIPTAMLTLPDGEVVQSLRAYVDNFLVIGTDKGVRFAVINDDGSLKTGSYIETDNPVLCFEPQEDFIWYGLTNYDSTSTGLGRMHLKTLNGSVPAYASDLMVTGQGAVTGVCTYEGKRILAVSGLGFYKESTNKVASAVLYPGWESFGIADNKIALVADVRHEPLAGSVALAMAVDGGTTYTLIGTSATEGETGTQLAVGERTAERFETSITLTRDSSLTTAGPTVTRRLLMVSPTADTGLILRVPFLFNETDNVGGTTRAAPLQPGDALEFIEGLRSTRDVVTYQSLSRSYAVQVEDFVFVPGDPTTDRTAWQGTCVTELKVV